MFAVTDAEIVEVVNSIDTKEFSVEEYPQRLRDYMLHKFTQLEDSTQMDYQRKFEINFSKFAHLPIVDALSATVSDVFDRYNQSELTYATFRIYRAALCYGIASYYEKWRRNELDQEVSASLSMMLLNDIYQLAIQKIDFTDEESAVFDKKPETSSLKAKRFEQGFYEYLVNIPKRQLTRTPKKQKPIPTVDLNYDKPIRIIDLLKCFVKANMLVGLRPIEWLEATLMCDIKTKDLIMRVKNAKHTHGRANGSHRTLVLSDIDETETRYLMEYYCFYQVSLERKAMDFLFKNNEFLAQQSLFAESGIKSNNEDQLTNIPVNLVATHTQTYLKNTTLEQMIDANGVPQAGCADKLNRALQNELYKKYKEYLTSIGQELTDISKRPTLYSTRHQCIANAKAGDKEPHEIAGFFGHASIRTNRDHYGKKAHGWSGWGDFKFNPTAESILQVSGGYEFLETCENNYYSTIDQNLSEANVVNETTTHYDKRSENNGLNL